MPYSGYTIQELIKLFRRSKQSLNQAGILDKIKKVYPFGEKFPLYDIKDVEEWHLKLIRFDGLVALGVIPGRGRGNVLIQDIILSSAYDSVCPGCGSFCVCNYSSSNLAWCPNCQFVQIQK